MDSELVRQSQSERAEATNGTSPAQSSTAESSTPATPTPPRLTPNPTLLDSPAPTLTPTSSSPPPPLTPAPSVSVSHVPKVAAGAPSPHALVPAPPKLTPTAGPPLRTYSRPILPSPSSTGISKTSSSSPTTQTPGSSSSSSSSPVVASTAPPLFSSSSAMHSNTSTAAKTSPTLTNGNTRLVSTPASTPITPFHTPASPPGRQVSQSHPLGSPGLVRANQSPSPVRQRVSQQALLLGKGLKGSGQDQVLLRAQMLILTSAMRPASSSSSSSSSLSSHPASAQLQSLTLRPPPPGTLTIPPSLRLKPPSSAPPPLSRPRAALFPPLRPRPQPSTTATESPTTPGRHLAIPPPTLYSPVRAVPLRPRLHSPNSHRAAAATLKQNSTLQPTAPVPSSQAPPISRPQPGPNTCPSSQSTLGPDQLQQSSLPASNPMPTTPYFERSPSAARQLQIIALSSTRQPQPATCAHAPPGVESPDLSSQSQRTLSSADVLPLPVNQPTKQPVPKTTSPPSLLCPSPPQSQTHTGVQQGKEGDQGHAGQEQREDRDRVKEEQQRAEAEEEEGGLISQKEHTQETAREEEEMDVTEEGQSARGRTEEKRTEKEVDTAMDQSEDRDPTPVTGQDSEPEALLGLTTAPLHSHRMTEAQRDVQPVHQEDFSEDLSTQSDNQSALSSLSSQSPPSSPFIIPSAENPPPLLAAQPAHPVHLSLSQHSTDKLHPPVADSQHLAEREPQPELLGQSEGESEGFSQPLSDPWVSKAWPEGRQVLTHLVEGFVIQEGLQPFPVNRSSLLLPEQASKPQEVNGTNGRAALPVTDTPEKVEHSTDSDEEEGGDTDDPGTRAGHRDRVVLHCQFCGKRGHAHNFMRSKRFCSTSCARGFNVRLTKRLRALSASSRSERPRPALNRAESVPGKPLLLRLSRDVWSAGRREKDGKEKMTAAEEEEEEEEEEDEEEEGGEEEDDEDGGEGDPAATMAMENHAERRVRRASAPALTTPTTTFMPKPSQWSVEEVTAFIHTLPGCSDVAEAFRLQEIDGQALLLLTEDHLMTSMNIKLGPALKICAHINALKNQ